jgi:PPOX class probable F420-dependent enzyme
MADLAFVEGIAAGDHHLAVLTTTKADGSVHASVVNAGITTDPVDDSPAIGLVALGDSLKLKLLRRSGRATLVFKDGYQWAAVSGPTRLIGPDDLNPDLNAPEVIRSVYRAAGGDHEDWEEFDRVMAADRRCAVFVRVETITSNAGA